MLQIGQKNIVLLNPPWDTVLQEGEKVIVIAEDNNSYSALPGMLIV